MKKIALATAALAPMIARSAVAFDGFGLGHNGGPPLMPMMDAQTLAFVQSEVTHRETEIYMIQYPNIQYPELIPVDFSAPEYVETVTFYSMDMRGEAKWVGSHADDVPFVGMERNQFQSAVYMAGIGYEYTAQEVALAQALGRSLTGDYGAMCMRAYEEFTDKIMLQGDPSKGLSGLIDYPGITIVPAPNGASASPLWSQKTADEVLADVNNLLSGVWIDSLTVELADTILLSEASFVQMANKRIPGTNTTLMSYIMTNNVLTLRTGRQLTIRTVRGLETGGAGGVARAVAYRNAPDVLKAHIPMRLRFMPVQVINLSYKVPGMFRLGGLDVRLPGAMRYLDGI